MLELLRQQLTPQIVELEEGFYPTVKHEGDAGADLKARIDGVPQFLVSENYITLDSDRYYLNGVLHDAENLGITQARYTMSVAPNSYYAVLRQNETVVIPLGIKLATPGVVQELLMTYYQIVPRSGFATKGLTITNSPGTVDSSYRGELMAIVTNLGKIPHLFTHQTRIAQGIYGICVNQNAFARADVLVPELDATIRNTGGFGSTGA